MIEVVQKYFADFVSQIEGRIENDDLSSFYKNIK